MRLEKRNYLRTQLEEEREKGTATKWSRKKPSRNTKKVETDRRRIPPTR